jgi:hypothetical protein
MVISITLVFSTCPPVSVLVRARDSCLEDFPGGMGSGTRRPFGQLASRLAVTPDRIYLNGLATRLPQVNHRLGSPTLPRPPIGRNGDNVVREYQPVGHRLRLSASP